MIDVHAPSPCNTQIELLRVGKLTVYQTRCRCVRFLPQFPHHCSGLVHYTDRLKKKKKKQETKPWNVGVNRKQNGTLLLANIQQSKLTFGSSLLELEQNAFIMDGTTTTVLYVYLKFLTG